MMRLRTQTGFTLIEMIVSLAVFSTVITIAVGALLILITSNRQLQDEQSVLTNVSFALDSMTREMRTGIKYACFNANNTSATFLADMFQDGVDLDDPGTYTGNREERDCMPPNDHVYRGVTFVEGGDSITSGTGERIVYFFYDGSVGSDPRPRNIYRRVGTGDAEPILADDIYVVDAKFFVTGSEPLTGTGADQDDNQASVTIVIEAASDATAVKTHRLQTTVVQRTLDL